MEWIVILNEIFRVCIIPLLGLLTTYAIKYISAKEEESKKRIEESQVKIDTELTNKYVSMLFQTITDCVVATNQTYVDSLKDKNVFTHEAQAEAFKKTSEAVTAILSDDAKEYLTNLYGDLNAFIAIEIEAIVQDKKKEK